MDARTALPPSRTSRSRAWIARACVCVALGSTVVASARADEPAPATDPKEDAKKRFERGVELMNQKVWDEALVEFTASRRLFPSRGNTQNAAVCLRELGRFDEALDMFDALLKEFSSLAESDRTDVAAEIRALREHVGTVEVLVLEPGARVIVDGRERGETPLSSPIRVNAGAHVVRVVKAGFAPFEGRVDVRPRENTQVDGVLSALQASGELSVTSADDVPADVIVDGVAVGRAPWSGRVAVGMHAVALRADGDRGTAPVAAPVKVDATTTLRLEPKPLAGALRVEPTPANAAVAIDGVEIGRGVWEGRLPAGAHTIEIAAAGFQAVKRSITLGGKPEQLRVELERDADDPMWKQKRPGRALVSASAAPLVAPVFGGDDVPGVGLGLLASLRAGYALGIGVEFELEAGVVLLASDVDDRPATLTPRGLPANQGTLDESLRLLGAHLGASIGYETRGDWPFLARASGGVVLGQVRDTRAGSFVSNLDGRAYDVPAIAESSGVVYGYVAPEIGIGRRFGTIATLRLDVAGWFLFAPEAPSWKDEQAVLAGPCDGLGPCEGEATFGSSPLTSETIIAIAPGLTFELSF